MVRATLALAGAATFYGSAVLAAFAGAFFLAAHFFVLWYEEPVLSARFGAAYEGYRRRVRRWWPGRGGARI